MEAQAIGRRSAKALAELLLPRSTVVWRGSEQASLPGRVALTFDDGPSELTLEYLAALERLGVRATFFVLGRMCRLYPELVKEIAERGHELASHGYSHRRFTRLSDAQLRSELDSTRALLPSDQEHVLVRPPHGAISLRSVLTCARAGYTTVLWSLDSGDWQQRDATAVARTFTTRPVAAGEIALLHEGQPWTINALPTIVESVRKAGHELVTVRELLA
jgi:peptidoglycan/xylan/chitin deacetylase (PgdA/CDA1 family)